MTRVDRASQGGGQEVLGVERVLAWMEDIRGDGQSLGE